MAMPNAPRQFMLRWKIFLVACTVVAGVLLKAGAPLVAVVAGLAVAAVATWFRAAKD